MPLKTVKIPEGPTRKDDEIAKAHRPEQRVEPACFAPAASSALCAPRIERSLGHATATSYRLAASACKAYLISLHRRIAAVLPVSACMGRTFQIRNRYTPLPLVSEASMVHPRLAPMTVPFLADAGADLRAWQLVFGAASRTLARIQGVHDHTSSFKGLRGL